MTSQTPGGRSNNNNNNNNIDFIFTTFKALSTELQELMESQVI